MNEKYFEQLDKLLNGSSRGSCCSSCSSGSTSGSTSGSKFEKAVKLSLEPNMVLLALLQAYVMTESTKKENNQMFYMTIASMINLVLLNWTLV